MAKKHLKRLSAPKSWPIKRKKLKYVARPLPGGHSYENGTSLSVIFKDLLGYEITTKDIKNLLRHKEVLVDGRRRKSPRFMAGFMDVLTLKETKQNFRLIFSKKGMLILIEVPEAESTIKPCKITGKYISKGGKTMLRSHDGRTIKSEQKEIKPGDTILMQLPEQTVKDSFPLKEGSSVYLTGGSHIGQHGTLKKGDGKIAVIKVGKDNVSVNKKFVFVIGKEKPAIKLE